MAAEGGYAAAAASAGVGNNTGHSSGEEDASGSSATESDDGSANKGSAAGRVVKRFKEENIALEVLCGVTVALALIPEAVAFALSAGLTASIGLHSAWIIAFVTAILGGRPAMICGATGSLAVLVGDTVSGAGVEYLFLAVILMGVIEIILGLVGIGSLAALIPTPVMIGFCNGLALVIGLAQMGNFKDPSYVKAAANATLAAANATNATSRRLSSFSAFTNGIPFISGPELMLAIAITVVSFCICVFLPKLTTKVPGALVAIVVGTIFEWAIAQAVFHHSTPLVGDIAALHGSFPHIAWLNNEYNMPPLNFQTFREVLPLSITLAAVGLLESLMTLNLIDELTETKGNTRRECIGQGVANIICGVLGGMGGCAMLGQSMINIGSGARSRVSSATAGIVLCLAVMVAYPAINIIPVSALVGVMFDVVFHTFEWGSLKLMALAAMPLKMREKFDGKTRRSNKKIRRADAFIILVVTLVTLFTDLAVAVATGMILACFTFVYDTATQICVYAREEQDPDSGLPIKYYDVHGVLFFGSCAQFLSFFDEKNDPQDVRLVFDAGYIADYSAIQALNKLGERYGAHGKTVKLQQLKPGSFKLVQKSAGLMVKELSVSVESEEVLESEREHLNVEHWHQMPRESSQHSEERSKRGPADEGDDAFNQA